MMNKAILAFEFSRCLQALHSQRALSFVIFSYTSHKWTHAKITILHNKKYRYIDYERIQS